MVNEEVEEVKMVRAVAKGEAEGTEMVTVIVKEVEEEEDVEEERKNHVVS